MSEEENNNDLTPSEKRLEQHGRQILLGFSFSLAVAAAAAVSLACL